MWGARHDGRTALRLHTNDRDAASTATRPVWTLKKPVSAASVQVVSATVPNTAYNVPGGWIDTSLGSAIVGAGTYTAAGLAAEVQAALGGGFTCTYSTKTQKFTLSNPAAPSYLFATGPNVANSLAPTMGFAVADSGATAAYAAQRPALLLEPQVLLLCSEALTAGCQFRVEPAGADSFLSVARVPVTGAPGVGSSTWSATLYDQDMWYGAGSGVKLQKIDLFWVDEATHALVDLRDPVGGWSVELSIDVLDRSRA